MRCPRCGTAFAADAKFCTRDGARLIAVAAAPAVRPGAPMPLPQPPRGVPTVPGMPVRRDTEQRESPAMPRRREPLSHATLTGQVLDGRYRIVRKVGEGGMSFVYLAHDVSTNEALAIKILSPSLAQDANAMARLRREAGLGIRLEHPNICHIKRLGETEDGLVYVVMPFVDGELLADREHRTGTIPLEDAVRFVADIATGLHVAHQLKIVHRDLKPENIMVVKSENGAERAVVMDFGLAKERRAGADLEKLTATGIILGTPEFMSPEQLRGRPLDGRTDIYSLALLAFEMLTGKLPFQGRTQQEMMINRLRNEPTPLRRMRPDADFPPALERVLMRAMERDPDQRHQTAPEFAAAFAAAATGQGEAEPGLLGKLFGR